MPQVLQNSPAPSAASAAAATVKRYYFPAVGLTLLTLALVAFSDNLLTDVGQISNRTPRFVVHGVFCLGWFALFALQPLLIARANYQVHMRLGFAGAFVVLGVLVTTAYIYYAKYAEQGALPWLSQTNFIFLLSYVVCVSLAYVHRKTPARHKRYMLVGTLFILEPVLSRVGGHTGIDPFIVTPVGLVALFGSLVVYDRLVQGRVDRITLAGFAWLLAVWIGVPSLNIWIL